MTDREKQIVEYEKQKRKAFQRAKGMTNEQFWNWMNWLHAQAYEKACQHFGEAMEIELTPKQRRAVFSKAEEIREEWDGIHEVDIDFVDMFLQDVMIEVQREMNRAKIIHGDAFESVGEARHVITEEYGEVMQAVEGGNIVHAKREAVQLIGVLVKFLRTVNS